MKDFEKAKQEYNNIIIPTELSERVMAELNRAEKNRSMKKNKSKQFAFGKWISIAAAIIIGVFILGLNVNPVFAKEMEHMPLIGKLAEVLTFREYEINTEDYVIHVEIPTIEMISEDFSAFEESINEEIYELCEQYATKSIQNAMEYREAFIETGGTVDEWLEHDIRINVWYEVLLQTDEYLSVSINRAENWNSAGHETTIINIDLLSGEEVPHEEVLEATDTVYYEDNFAVDTEAAFLFGEKIKDAVASKDIEKLAELTAFPVYVDLDDGLIIETRDDFIALGADKIFTDDFVASITNADISNLTPSMAGFFVSATDAPPSITFGVVDGSLKIKGINY